MAVLGCLSASQNRSQITFDLTHLMDRLCRVGHLPGANYCDRP
jgi:hypothetical protein